MILVLASIADPAAVAFADDLAGATAASLFTCRDLAEQLMSLHHPDLQRSSITAGGGTVPFVELRGVVNLLPAVFPQELIFYPPEEREYQAAELHALLTFLLSALPCRVVNRATPESLTGPFANPLGWLRLARRLGIPTIPINIDSDAFVNPFAAAPGDAFTEVRYLSGTLIAPSGTPADEHTRELACAAPVEYLCARYVEGKDSVPVLRTVSTLPDVHHPATRRALIGLFCPQLVP